MKFFLTIFLFCFCVYAAENPVKELNISFDDFVVVDDNKKEDQEKVQPSPSKTQNNQQDKTSTTSIIKDFFSSNVQKIKDFTVGKSGTNTQNTNYYKFTNINKNNKNNPEDKFPDPFFYDAIYKEEPLFWSYKYVYNDKTNKDNLYIPKIQEFDIYTRIFEFSMEDAKKSDFYSLYNVLRDDRKFNINFQDQYGNTLLLTALYNGNFEIFFFLVTQGGDINICNNNDICPIQLAVYSNNVDVVKFLSKYDVDIMKKDKNGNSVLEYALYQKNDQIIFLLLDIYLTYPVNYQQRRKLVQFAENTGMTKVAAKMKEVFFN